MNVEQPHPSFASEKNPPREEWGTVRLSGRYYKDKQDRVFQVPFTNQELQLIIAARTAQQSLSEDMAKASGPERDFYVGCHIPFGYSLLDRRQALRNFRKIASIADEYLQSKPLSDSTRLAIQSVRNTLTPLLPPPPARQ